MFRFFACRFGAKPFQKPSTLTSSTLVSLNVAKRLATHQSITRTYPGKSINWPKILGQVGIIGGTIVGLNVFFNRETREGGIPPVEQEYLHETFKYVGAGLGITALMARGLHMSGWSSRLMMMNPWVVLGGGLVLSIGIWLNIWPHRTN